MSSSSVFPTTIGSEIDSDGLSAFARRMFSSMPRVDQRRWAEVYLRGLVYLEGRKSVRKMAENLLSMPVNQSLQQFINQSPWDWTPIRSQLAQNIEADGESRAWVINRAVMPKRGSHSVGVARQFVPEIGRTVNCQLGIGLFLTSATTVAPVNWRIILNGRWTDDESIRAKVYLPDTVQGGPEWAEILSMVDECSRQWDLSPAPVVADMPDAAAARALARAFDERGIDYILRVDESFRLLAGNLLGRPPGGFGPRPRLPYRGGPDRPVSRPDEPDHRPRDQFVSVLVPLVSPDKNEPPGPVVRLVGQRPFRGRKSCKLWITSLTQLPLDEVIFTAGLANRGTHAIRLLESRFGLQDFEGRSFRGWHHHMTMVSVAWAFSQLNWSQFDWHAPRDLDWTS